MTKTKICGPQRIGASVMDEGDLTRAVVASYSTATQDEAREGGQRAAEQVLPARRRLWALAERLIPQRLAAALRARCGTDDPTARDGVRALRLALADWLDPPPVCRWCRAPIRPGDEGRVCQAARGRRQRAAALAAGGQVALLVDHAGAAHGAPSATTRARKWTPRPVPCRPARTPALGPVARCGTLALYTAGQVSLEVMAAALAVPKGAAKGYDVACDRDAKALTVATADAPPPGRDLGDPDAWQDEALRRMYEAVAGLGTDACIPAPIKVARRQWRRLRGLAVQANGRAVLGIQTRYYAPCGRVGRADLVQGAAIGADRGLQDYDATQSRYTTYGADWMRQGCGEAWGDRDLVGTPEWVHALRGKIEDRLPSLTRADVLRAIEALADAVTQPAARDRASALAEELARLVVTCAEIRENVLGSRPARYVRRPLFADQSEDAIDAHAFAALRVAVGKRKKAAATATATAGAEDPERVRERIADWLAARLRLPKASGSGMLTALRHGAPVFVAVGAGGDDDDAETQGGSGDGGGGSQRLAAVLAAPDEADALADEEVGRARWQAALSALAALQASGGREAAEIVRRHHGLDSLAEDRGGQTGESFASIAQAGLVSTGRTLTREGVRKIYVRGLAALQAHLAGRALPSLDDDDEDYGPVRVPRSPWRPLPPPLTPAPSNDTTPTARPPVADAAAWDTFREAAAEVAW